MWWRLEVEDVRAPEHRPDPHHNSVQGSFTRPAVFPPHSLRYQKKSGWWLQPAERSHCCGWPMTKWGGKSFLGFWDSYACPATLRGSRILASQKHGLLSPSREQMVGIPTELVSSVFFVCLFCFRHPPANMTYNIFIMNGKSWWQKSQEMNLRKIVEKQKHLKCNSYV